MADDNQLAEATQPLSFAEFLERMKEPSAADLVRAIKNFIKTFDDRPCDPERDGQHVQDFLARSESVFRQHPVWASAPPEHQAQATEGLEKYLMTKIYSKTFAQSPLDRERDEALSQRMAALAFVRPEHLDIPEAYQDEKAWLLAMKELHKINQYKAPRDKIVCILNCCRVINNLLHVAIQQGEARGADDFLPVLIYVVIHANPPQLASNLEYIQRFRMQSRMQSESAYFFTQLYSAACFIETINTNSLSMDPDEFIARMVAAGIPDMQVMPTPSSPSFRHSSPPPVVVTAPVTSTSARAPPAQSPTTNTATPAATPAPSTPPASQAQSPSRSNAAAASPALAPIATSVQPRPQPQQVQQPQQAQRPPPTAPPAAPQPNVQQRVQQQHAQPQQQQHAQQQPPQQQQRVAEGSPSRRDEPASRNPSVAAGPAAQQHGAGYRWPSLAELQAEGVARVLEAEQGGGLQQRHKYLYASPQDLRLGDISQLLTAYKELVLRYEAMSLAITHRHQHQPRARSAAASLQQQLLKDPDATSEQRQPLLANRAPSIDQNMQSAPAASSLQASPSRQPADAAAYASAYTPAASPQRTSLPGQASPATSAAAPAASPSHTHDAASSRPSMADTNAAAAAVAAAGGNAAQQAHTPVATPTSSTAAGNGELSTMSSWDPDLHGHDAHIAGPAEASHGVSAPAAPAVVSLASPVASEALLHEHDAAAQQANGPQSRTQDDVLSMPSRSVYNEPQAITAGPSLVPASAEEPTASAAAQSPAKNSSASAQPQNAAAGAGYSMLDGADGGPEQPAADAEEPFGASLSKRPTALSEVGDVGAPSLLDTAESFSAAEEAAVADHLQHGSESFEGLLQGDAGIAFGQSTGLPSHSGDHAVASLAELASQAILSRQDQGHTSTKEPFFGDADASNSSANGLQAAAGQSEGVGDMADMFSGLQVAGNTGSGAAQFTGQLDSQTSLI